MIAQGYKANEEWRQNSNQEFDFRVQSLFHTLNSLVLFFFFNLISLKYFWNFILPKSLTYVNFFLILLKSVLDFSLESSLNQINTQDFLDADNNRPQRSAFSVLILHDMPLPSPKCSQNGPSVPFWSAVGSRDQIR